MTRYERERPGTGGTRAAVDGYLNRKFWDDPRCKEDAKGWVQPFANWQGWDEWNQAAYALRSAINSRAHLRKEGLSTTTCQPLPYYRPASADEWHAARAAMYHGSTLARIESDLRTVRFSLARSMRCDRPAIP